MKANDLRIGNWLHLYDKQNGEPFYSQVTGLTENGKIWFVRHPKHNDCAWRPEKIKPIPLTEEWLIKFGFKKWKNGEMFSVKNFIIYWKAKSKCYGYGKSHLQLKIKYVHQLQNLYFALTDEELTIEQ